MLQFMHKHFIFGTGRGNNPYIGETERIKLLKYIQKSFVEQRTTKLFISDVNCRVGVHVIKLPMPRVTSILEWHERAVKLKENPKYNQQWRHNHTGQIRAVERL